jgi:hypothetical protein
VSINLDYQIVILERFLPFLQAPDLLQCAPVCKLWNYFFSQPLLWKEFCEGTGLPLAEAQGYDYKKHFRILYPMTLNGNMICQVLGEMVGKVPTVNSLFLEKLEKEDPFAPGIKIRNNYQLVILPSRIKRISGRDLALDQSGNLIADPTFMVKDLIFELSLKNMELGCRYSLVKKREEVVFCQNNFPEVFDQPFSCADAAQLYLMRKSIVKESVNKVWEDQKAFIEKVDGCQVTPLIVRTLSCCISKCLFGTFLDEQSSWSFARTANRIYFPKMCQLSVGGCSSQPGVHITCDDGFEYPDTGVVPCFRVDVDSRNGFH